jgi:branched-chain amino acid transport system substrate-binding protein
MRHTNWLRAAAAVTALGLGAASAQAQDTLRFAQCYDLSKAYTFITPQVSQAAKDLATLVNLKGGIGGKQVEVITQDHGNEPQRGIECYERLKRDGVFVFDFLSTPVVNAAITRIMQDQNILLQSFVGRGDAVDGSVFQWSFPVGPTYWGQAANNIAFIKEQRGGDLKGAKIAFTYLDYPFGQEPIGVLKTLAEREGFQLELFPVALPGNDQASTWTQMRRYQPDYIISWLLAGGHVVAAREMKRNGIPLDKYISVNWFNEVDIANLGAAEATGIKRGTSVVGGQDIPLIQEIIATLYDKGQGAGPREKVNDVYFNTGLAIYSVAFEAARIAMETSGEFTPASMKAALESLKDFDANGLMAPVTVTAEDHGGGGKTRIEMWNGTTWEPQSDWISAYDDVIWEVVKTYSAKFAAENK